MIKEFHHKEFENTEILVKQKLQKKISISVVLPALNEASTIGAIITYIKENLVQKSGLVDEIIVIDGDSTDDTAEVSQRAGATVYNIYNIVSDMQCIGKGTALWKSLFITDSDIIIFVDSDILDFDKRFINGLAGPLLSDETVNFVKAFYKRPLFIGNERYENYGGRVTEIMVRPLLSTLFPELAKIIQPLAGEYAIRGSAANELPFWSGYGVEIGLLLDIFATYGLSSIAQVNMDDRHHRNRNVLELSKMSFGILHVMLIKLERMGKIRLTSALNDTLFGVNGEETHTFADVELPPRAQFIKQEFLNANS